MRQVTSKQAIEAGVWAIGLGALEYVTTSTDVEAWLDSLMPHQLVPLVAIVLGGLGLTVRWLRTSASVQPPTVEEPAPAELQTVHPDPAPALVPAASAATPPAAAAATEAAGAIVGSSAAAAIDPTDGATPAAVPGPSSTGALAPAPVSPPTSFIPLPTR